MSILEAIFVEAFCTIHMTVFVLLPISKMLDPDKNKNLFKKLFIGRIIFLLFYDIFIGTYIAMVDFFMIFLGAFIIVPIFFSNTQKENKENIYSNVLIDEEIKSGYDGSYLFLLEKMKQYFELDEFLLSELDSFLNKNKQNTIEARPKILILNSPDSQTTSIAVTKKTDAPEFEKIIITQNKFNIIKGEDKIEGPIKYN